MIITKIAQQVKAKERYSIYVDGKYSFSLSEFQLAEMRLRKGQKLTESELKKYATESQFGKAYDRTLNYLAVRPRSEREVRDYLTRTYLYPKPKSYIDKTGQRIFKKQIVDKPTVKSMIERVVVQLRERKYLNDEEFARAWVESRLIHKKPSKRRLQQELQQKGVDSKIIATVLQNENINERDILLELVHKKRKMVRYQDDNKLIAYLLRQGFGYDDVRGVLNEIAR